MRGALLRAFVALAVLVAVGRPLAAQGIEETRLLREAAARESRGDLDGAERVLRRLLEASPSSSGGLFALERVLRAKGEPGAILPVADTFLAHDAAASGVRSLKLRVLVEVDSLGAVEDEAEGWLKAQPGSETAYREVARVYERAFGPERALGILRRGRAALGGGDVLALETGDLLAQEGRVDDAVSEWAKVAGTEGTDIRSITRRITGLPQGGAAAAQRLVDELGRSSDPARVRAGALAALELRLSAQALSLSRRVAQGLDERARTSFLSDVARRARDAQLGDVATWAYGELGQDAGSPAERRQFDQRLVEVSLAKGDTAAALEAQRRVVKSFTPGSVDHRRAAGRVIELESASASPARLRGLLDYFRRDFPDAPELDELAATVAGALLSRGDAEGAAAVLEGIQGPRSALQRGYLLLAGGDLTSGRQALLLALPGLEPSQATDVIQLVGLLGRLSPAGADLLAQAGVRAHAGEGDEAAAIVGDGLEDVPEKDRPALLAEAARMAATEETAAGLRARLLEGYSDAPEAAEASLELARYRATTPDGVQEAIRLLEDLVTNRPNAAVVPDARRELERLRRMSG